MKKPILAVIALLLVAAMVIPAHAEITGYTWLGAKYTYDDYYNQWIYGYKEGTTAVLAVWVRNNYTGPNARQINVTKVYVSFDWGEKYEAAQISSTNPFGVIIQAGTQRVLYVNFTVPSIAVASNMYTHAYTIYSDYKVKNATGTNWFSRTYESAIYQDFVVYSEDQATAVDLARIIDDYPMPSYWRSTRAEILSNKAENETASARAYYQAGDFTHAKQRFATALDYLNQAWDAEEAYLTVWEELDMEETRAHIRYFDAMSSFLNGLSTMWVLLGIGWVLLGIGYIIKYLRAKRPEAAAA
ncbi:MAG: hypothetical protein ACQXXH_05255 [Candidatus Bathyarchaeia archaeon]|jgi:tetratricopeptide (TPR) repeat protein|nr:hypothetical protein [Candidatus Bathyarchaeota archaeon A05DMB-4]MDH7595672.1 hypothetical protein [Candidatus Bathyarchaeota archaeon]